MGGLRLPPGGTIAERIVFVDSPELVEKYERKVRDAEQAANIAAELARQEKEESRARALLLEKQLNEARDQLVKASSPQPKMQEGPTPISAYKAAKLTEQVEKFKRELAAAHATIHAMKARAAVPTLSNQKDKWAARMAFACAVGMAIGTLIGKVL